MLEIGISSCIDVCAHKKVHDIATQAMDRRQRNLDPVNKYVVILMFCTYQNQDILCKFLNVPRFTQATPTTTNVSYVKYSVVLDV